MSIEEKLGENEYIANKPEKGKVVKHVTYYLAQAKHAPLILEKKGGLDEARWFLLKEASGLRMYDDIKPLIEKSKVILQNKVHASLDKS